MGKVPTAAAAKFSRASYWNSSLKQALNDLVFAPNGDLYFTDQGETGLQDPTGRVYRLSASGVLTMLINTVPSPNGIVIDAGMTNLFVAATRAQQIWRIPLQASGRIAKGGFEICIDGLSLWLMRIAREIGRGTSVQAVWE